MTLFISAFRSGGTSHRQSSPFATSGGSGMGGEDVLRSACSKGTKWLPGKRLSSRESMASVQKWVESLGL